MDCELTTEEQLTQLTVRYENLLRVLNRRLELNAGEFGFDDWCVLTRKQVVVCGAWQTESPLAVYIE